MPTLDGWIGGTLQVEVATAQNRAALAWRRINDRPSQISLLRGSGSTKAKLDAQTIRLEFDNTARYVNGQLTTSGAYKAIVFGIRDHATLADTDIERSDRFTMEGVTYEVMSLMTPPGEVQAICEAVRAS